MIKGVIFDFDGLLVDSEKISYDVYRKILKKYGYEFEKAEYGRNYSGKTALANRIRLIEEYHLPLNTDEERKMEEAFKLDYTEADYALKPGAVELLEYLHDHHYGIAVASSSLKPRLIRIMEYHGILKYFNEFVTAEDTTQCKPDPEVFLKACEKLALPSESCLVLEDSEAGIEAAYNGHIKVICVPDMKYPSEAHVKKTEAVVNSLSDVIDYLENA